MSARRSTAPRRQSQKTMESPGSEIRVPDSSRAKQLASFEDDRDTIPVSTQDMPIHPGVASEAPRPFNVSFPPNRTLESPEVDWLVRPTKRLVRPRVAVADSPGPRSTRGVEIPPASRRGQEAPAALRSHTTSDTEDAPASLRSGIASSRSAEIPLSTRISCSPRLGLVLTFLRDVDGYVAVAVVEADTGSIIVSDCMERHLNVGIVASATASMVRMKMSRLRAEGLPEAFEEVVLSIGNDHHIVRPLRNAFGLFMMLIVRKPIEELLSARLALETAQRNLDEPLEAAAPSKRR